MAVSVVHEANTSIFSGIVTYGWDNLNKVVVRCKTGGIEIPK